MHVVWGIAIAALGFLAWAGQLISWVAPDTAARLTLTEREENVEPAFWADLRGEAAWDTFTLWTMVVAGVLLALDVSGWAYFGLVGGGMYAYFGGRGILSRRAHQRKGLRIGSSSDVAVAYAFLTVWAVMGVIAIVAAVETLSG